MDQRHHLTPQELATCLPNWNFDGSSTNSVGATKCNGSNVFVSCCGGVSACGTAPERSKLFLLNIHLYVS